MPERTKTVARAICPRGSISTRTAVVAAKLERHCAGAVVVEFVEPCLSGGKFDVVATLPFAQVATRLDARCAVVRETGRTRRMPRTGGVSHPDRTIRGLMCAGGLPA